MFGQNKKRLNELNEKMNILITSVTNLSNTMSIMVKELGIDSPVTTIDRSPKLPVPGIDEKESIVIKSTRPFIPAGTSIADEIAAWYDFIHVEGADLSEIDKTPTHDQVYREHLEKAVQLSRKVYELYTGNKADPNKSFYGAKKMSLYLLSTPVAVAMQVSDIAPSAISNLLGCRAYTYKPDVNKMHHGIGIPKLIKLIAVFEDYLRNPESKGE